MTYSLAAITTIPVPYNAHDSFWKERTNAELSDISKNSILRSYHQDTMNMLESCVLRRVPRCGEKFKIKFRGQSSTFLDKSEDQKWGGSWFLNHGGLLNCAVSLGLNCHNVPCRIDCWTNIQGSTADQWGTVQKCNDLTTWLVLYRISLGWSRDMPGSRVGLRKFPHW